MHLRPFVNIINLKRMNYEQALKVQKFYVKKLQESPGSSSRNNTLLLVEHSPVYTIGLRTDNYPKSEEERLKKLGADFFRTDRGGLITFHGPGQLVAYPILNLLNFNDMSVRCYVNDLEETIIDVCSNFNLKGERSPHTGVWINDDKICAMGIHVSRRITSHGLALNCNTDLNWYKHIVPCGISDKGVTSLSKLTNRDINIDEVTSLFLNSFQKVFQCECSSIEDFNEC